MFRPLMKFGGIAVMLGLLAATSPAVVWNLSTTMNGASEVPSNGSTATGTFTATYDTVTDILTYNLTVNGLGSVVTLAHVHGLAPAGVNAPPLIDLIVVPGQTSFVYDGVAQPTPANAATFESALQMGVINAYINVHSQGFPGGEIRGQLTAVPEPITLAILAPAALLALRKRRK